mmetsp:Transcript_17382/g.20864  ORF Transcript_17382/g.20864 Transcript_17382/m.20864 type:complete len:382 (+) Transcript_17382:485-1630(+)
MSLSLARTLTVRLPIRRHLPLRKSRQFQVLHVRPLGLSINGDKCCNNFAMFSSTSVKTTIAETESSLTDSLKEKLLRKERYRTVYMNPAHGCDELSYNYRANMIIVTGYCFCLSRYESKLRQDAVNRSREFDSKYNWVLRLLGYYGTESLVIQKAVKLFHTLEVQSQRNGFKRLLNIDLKEETSFQSTQQLLMLHTWMIHRRLLKEGEEGRMVQENLFDNVWEDTRRRIRAAGINELSVNKHLMETQKWSFGSCVTFDHGFEIENDNNEELATALWRAVFQSDSSVPDRKVLHLAKYVRRQMKLLEDLSREDFLDGKIKWLDPPASMAEDMLDDSHVRLWRPTYSASGRKYYWNVYTRESRWDPVVEDWESDEMLNDEEKK